MSGTTRRVRGQSTSRTSVILLMGVAGCGKTTTGQKLSRALGWDFRDADSFHPAANVEKMRLGMPLNDDDRWPWLAAIAAWIDERRASGNAIVSCSALKRVYRDRLLAGRPDVQLVFLKGSRTLIADRMSRRKDHFMPPSLLASQFETLEEPGADEGALVIEITMPPSRVVERIIQVVAP
jgi:gluconokinase